MTVCPECRPEWEAWLHAPVLHQERRVYSRADRTIDLLDLNHRRYSERVRAQLRAIEKHCRQHHQKETSHERSA